MLFENNPHPMWVYDLDTLAFLAVNDTAIQRYGYTREEFLGMTIAQIRPPEDVPALLENVSRVTEGLDEAGVWRHRKQDGTEFEVEIVSHTIAFAGRKAEMVLAQDITERRRAERALRESERKFATVFRSSPDMVGILTLEEGRYLDVNAGYERILGYSRGELVGRTIHELGIWADPVPRATLVESLRRDGAVRNWEVRYRAKSGRLIVGLVSAEIIDYGEEACVLSVTRDVTERKQAEESLRLSEERLRLALMAAGLGLYDLDVRTGTAEVNAEYARMLGHDPDSFRESTGAWFERLHPDDRERVVSLYRDYIAGEVAIFRVESRQRAASGEWKWILSIGKVVERDPDGRPRRMLGTHMDITDHKRAEAEIRELAKFPAESPNPVLRVTPEGCVSYTNRAGAPLLAAWACRVGQRLPDAWCDVIRQTWQSGEVRHAEVQVGDRSVSLTFAPVPIAGYVNLYGSDLTDRKRAEAALRESEAKLQSIFRATPAGIGIVVNRILKSANQRLCEMVGYTEAELIQQSARILYPSDEDFEYVGREKYAQIRAAGVGTVETRWRRKDGSEFPVLLSSAPMNPDDWGAGVIFTALNITDRVRAEAERRAFEEQIRQVQKLESLGLLAGGIAHDFNNLLMAILGNADLALQVLPVEISARSNLEEIVQVSRRAADLCRQMLAYSGKGRFVVEKLDLSEVVREMAHMLQVSVSKKATLHCSLVDRLPAIEADVTQVRQVVMNLITNASEALTDESGVIAVTTGCMDCDRASLSVSVLGAEASAGRYVFCEVSDTGCGMDAAMQKRIFDPFFSTKFAGRGLGLAAVLGIVRGHRGVIQVDSKPGRGSTFRVLFPASTGVAPPPAARARTDNAWRGHGTVLLVDDEERVRSVSRRMLEAIGFHVLTAADGEMALELFRTHADAVTCVILDLTMPHMGGEEAFDELRRIRADVPIILSSGYNEQEVTQRFVGGGLAGFIQKPYAVAGLREVLRRVVGR
jgi:PAS domain S-box-containing protein